MKFLSVLRAAAVSLVLMLVCLSFGTPAYASPSPGTVDALLTFQLTEVPADYQYDVTITLLNTDTQETYNITAHFVGDYTNTATVRSGHYLLTGVQINDYYAQGYVFTPSMEEFDVTGDMTFTGTLRLGSDVAADEGYTDGCVPTDPTYSDEYPEGAYVEPDVPDEPPEDAPDETVSEETVPEKTVPEEDTVIAPTEDDVTEEPSENTDTEEGNLEGVLGAIALVLVVIAIAAIASVAYKAYQNHISM